MSSGGPPPTSTTTSTMCFHIRTHQIDMGGERKRSAVTKLDPKSCSLILKQHLTQTTRGNQQHHRAPPTQLPLIGPFLPTLGRSCTVLAVRLAAAAVTLPPSPYKGRISISGSNEPEMIPEQRSSSGASVAASPASPPQPR
ncbi:unnamed protein product [Pleuronectes platessa]|uniref:Uncharacterized protein n=1 Tax=Pleuronectes platessa TaxID=8262 RepID=A0A9N7U8R0_PLEPL|nr:unnamed protein product [Pleuronectes platessa]